MDRADRWTTPVLILFFVISGAELDLSVFTQWAVVIVGVAYIISRSLGKYYGANISARIAKSNPNIVKYLGITLLPQAGVALGMSAIVLSEMEGGQGTLIRSIVLFAVLVYEIFGPVITKIALTKSGDITQKTTEGFDRKKFLEESKHRERHHRHHK